MKEDYVSFETAKLLKEKGFDESTIFVYYDFLPSSLCFPKEECRRGALNLFYYNETTQVNNRFNNSMSIPKYISGGVYSAPTLQMAMKWLREVHNVFIEIHFWQDTYEDVYCEVGWKEPTYNYRIIGIGNNDADHVDIDFNSYESACESAIKYCLTNLI